MSDNVKYDEDGNGFVGEGWSMKEQSYETLQTICKKSDATFLATLSTQNSNEVVLRSGEDGLNDDDMNRIFEIKNKEDTEYNIWVVVNQYGSPIRIGITGHSNIFSTDEFYDLTSLEVLAVELDLGYFKLDNRVAQFTSLLGVFIYDGYEGELPKGLVNIESLHTLYLGHGNNLTNLPAELISSGIDAIRNYFESLHQSNRTDNLLEAKMVLVGRGFAGKTTLLNKLTNPKYKLKEKPKSTEGIDIQYWDLELPALKQGQFRYNVWDFGGQEKYDATHQFFITERSLYLFVTEARQESNYLDFDYWLNIVRILSNDSPVIVVKNKIDERNKELETEKFQKQFPNIRKFVDVSCAEGYEKTIGALTEEIKSATLTLPQVRDELPEVWVEIRDELKKENRDWISYREYLSICSRKGLDNKKADYLSAYFHDLGVVVHHLKDPLLKGKVILDPDWAVDAVYSVLDSDVAQKKKGKFTFEDLESIWSEDRYENMRLELLMLMKNYELCFEIGNSRVYIAPELLPANPSTFDKIKSKNPLTFNYSFGFMPSGLISRFIVKAHKLIKDEIYWRGGVVIEREGAVALVTEDRSERCIQIKIDGEHGKRELLAIIRNEFQNIFGDFKRNFEYSELTPCICSRCLKEDEKHFYAWQTLLRYYRKRIDFIRCELSLEEVSVNLLVGNVTKSPEMESPRFSGGHSLAVPKQKKAKLFYSYAHEDEQLRDELEKHLANLRNQGLIEFWHDRKIRPGMDWDGEISEHLEAADVILLLISSDFMASSYINENELTRALEREKDKSATVVPIILRSVDWYGSSFAHLQALPKSGRPVTSWPNQDEAWTDVSSQLRTILTDLS